MAKELAKKEEVQGRAGARQQQVVGEVISDKMSKTITVQSFRRVRHPKYGKFLKKTSIYKVHDEKNQAKKGDKVLIQMTRPLSKTKRWRLLSIVERGEADLGGLNV